MYHVYILKMNDNSYYTGFTSKIRQRINDHKNGWVVAARNKKPLKLVFCCMFPRKKQAINFEKYLKTGSGQAFRNRHFT